MTAMAREPDHRRGAGVLHVVATPIGNSADITLRALEVLREADVVVCEDTRRAGSLLAAHQIRKPLLSYFEHNEAGRVPQLVERLVGGERIALITDAGTPAISDPGYRLVRAAHEAGVRVTAVPGASAAIAALSISGIGASRFAFEGFLAKGDAARAKALRAVADEPRTMIFYEAARRLSDTLSAMAKILGGDRAAAVVREITKIHEEIVRGTIVDLARRFAGEQALGEIVIVVEGAAEKGAGAGRAQPALMVGELLDAGLSVKQASALTAKLTGVSRREVYQQALQHEALAREALRPDALKLRRPPG